MFIVAVISVRVLTPGDYSDLLTAQGLLIVVAASCLSLAPAGRSARAVSWWIYPALGVVFAAGTGGALLAISGPRLAIVGAAAAFALAVLAAPVGALRSAERGILASGFRGIGVLTRVVLIIALVERVRTSALPAVVAIPAAAAVATALAVAGLVRFRPARPLRLDVRPGLFAGLLTTLAFAGTVAVRFIGADPNAVVALDLAIAIGRLPLLVGDVVLAASARTATLRVAMTATWVTALPTMIVLLSVPRSVLRLLAPQQTHEVAELLRLTAGSGALLAMLTVLVAACRGQGRHIRAGLVLGAAAVALPGATIASGRLSDLLAVAIAEIVVCGAAGIGLLAVTWQWSPWPMLQPYQVVLLIVGAALSVDAISVPWLWLVTTVLMAGLAVDGLRRLPQPATAAVASAPPVAPAQPASPAEPAVTAEPAPPAEQVVVIPELEPVQRLARVIVLPDRRPAALTAIDLRPARRSSSLHGQPVRRDHEPLGLVPDWDEPDDREAARPHHRD